MSGSRTILFQIQKCFFVFLPAGSLCVCFVGLRFVPVLPLMDKSGAARETDKTSSFFPSQVRAVSNT